MKDTCFITQLIERGVIHSPGACELGMRDQCQVEITNQCTETFLMKTGNSYKIAVNLVSATSIQLLLQV